MFPALMLTRDSSGIFSASLEHLSDDMLAEHASQGDVEIDVAWSTMNYKDALALTNRSPVVRKWPMVAGIDGAGVVRASRHPDFAPGDEVLLNGWGVGETHWGCLAGKARLRGDWLIRKPDGLSARETMAIGTAGYTAMLCIQALQAHGVEPRDGEVLVTGAAGGVGSMAVMLLSAMGYQVVASTGRPELAAWLQDLGAAQVLPRSELAAAGKPLQKERWAGVVDSVGGHTLANAIAQTRYRGTVAACGLAGGMDLPSSVAPFILRGVTLAGVDSVMCPMPQRRQAWAALAQHTDRTRLASLVEEIGLGDALARAPDLLAGQVRGRLVVDVSR